MDNKEILARINQRSEALKGKCPVDALPVRLQEIIKHFVETKGYPEEYLFTGILVALSTAIGNSHHARTVNGYKVVAIIFAVIIGRRGFNKSEALTDAFKPIEKFKAKLFLEYREQLAIYNDLSKEEKEGRLPPIFGKPILDDATIEALIQSLANYPKGVCLVIDELAKLMKSLDRYAKGSDEQTFLSAWSAKGISVDRIGRPSLYIPDPFLSIVGTIQPEVAEKVFSDKEESGFYDRFLICYPERLDKPYPSNNGLNPSVIATYEAIINKLLGFEVNEETEPVELTYTPESWEIVLEWIKRNTDAENDLNTTATEGGIRAKMDIYLHRFCLILQLASYACGGTFNKETIEPQTARNAIKIANYFYYQAEKKRIKDRSELLPTNWKAVFDFLPDNGMEFTTAEFLQRTEMMEIKERTAKDWLKNNSDRHGNKVLIKIKHGTYAKS